MESRGESDTEAARRAYVLLDAELARASGGPFSLPTDEHRYLTKLTAGALLSWVRCATDGNGMVVSDDGRPTTADTQERRELWAENAPKVLRLVKDVGTDPALDPEVKKF